MSLQAVTTGERHLLGIGHKMVGLLPQGGCVSSKIPMPVCQRIVSSCLESENRTMASPNMTPLICCCFPVPPRPHPPLRDSLSDPVCHGPPSVQSFPTVLQVLLYVNATLPKQTTPVMFPLDILAEECGSQEGSPGTPTGVSRSQSAQSSHVCLPLSICSGMKRPLSPSPSGEKEPPTTAASECPPHSPESSKPKRERKRPSYTLCDVCNIQLNSAAQAQVHCGGRAHQRRLRQLSLGKTSAGPGQ